MKSIYDYSHLEVDGHETTGVVYYLLDKVGGKWDDALTDDQTKKAVEILNAEFESEEGEEIFWGWGGCAFYVEDNVWVAK